MAKREARELDNAGWLVVAILASESSYLNNTEELARAVPDTVQFWLGQDSTWRIRTYATDHDIHIYSMDGLPGENPEDRTRPYVEHIEKHYGDIYNSLFALPFHDYTDTKQNEKVLTRAGLDGQLEVASAGFAFYNPDREKYRTQSTPLDSEDVPE